MLDYKYTYIHFIGAVLQGRKNVTELKMKSPDVNPGDQVVRDRQSKDIAEDEGRWSFPSWPEDELGR